MTPLQISKPSDPLAALRIDRGSDRPRPRPSRNKKLAWILILLALVACGALAWAQFGEQFLRTEVRLASVEVRLPGVADSVLAAQGYLKSRTQAAIGAKVAGRVSKIYVEEGESVKPRDPLAELEHEDMKALLEAMNASLAATRISIDKAEAEKAEAKTQLAQDERDLIRAEQLSRGKALGAAELEKAQSKRQASEERYRSLEASLELAKARLLEAEARQREAQEQIQNYIVMAPPLPDGADPEKFRWTVISKESEVGESIMPGGMGAGSGRGSVVMLANLLNLEVETDVKEDYVGRVRTGQQVNVSVDGVKDRTFTGTVRTIIPMGDRAKGTVKVKVKLTDREVEEVNDLAAKRFRLFPEMAATVNFLSEGKEAQGGKVEPQIYVAADSVKTEDDSTFVWQVVNERLKRTPIEAGETREGRVLVQSGLKPGDQTIVNPPTTLKEDQLVKVVQ